jgi:hypothetical protein
MWENSLDPPLHLSPISTVAIYFFRELSSQDLVEYNLSHITVGGT